MSKRNKRPQRPQPRPAASDLQQKGFFRHNLYILLAFLIPAVLMLIRFMTVGSGEGQGIYPFGDQQVLVVDMWHQYFPFFNELHEKLTHFDSLFYSWNTGLGTNFVALIAYYAASPLNLLSVLCPSDYLVEFLGYSVIIKIACAGMFFAIFLRSTYHRNDISITIFSVLYALCAYSLGYYWCVMWLDCVALLPLIILGLNKLIDEGKYKLFTISLALALISNYYIGVFICIFVALYYIVAYLTRYSAFDYKALLKTTGRVLLFSLIGVGIACVIILPTWNALQLSYAATNTAPKEMEFYRPVLDIFNNMLTDTKYTFRGGIANIYCGLFSVIMFILFLMNKRIRLKEKCVNLALAAFLILSFNNNYLDFAWHGFHFPNELPFRFSFVFSFLIVALAYRAFHYLDDISVKQISAVLIGGVLYLLLVNKICADTLDSSIVYVSMIFLILFCTVLILYKTKNLNRAALLGLVALLVLSEGVIATQNSLKEDGGKKDAFSSRSGYRTNVESMENVLGQIAERDGSFYRIEKSSTYTINDPALYTYRGVSQFSSSANKNVTTLLNKLGIAGTPASNRYTYHLTSPVTNSMLGIKYIVNKDGTTDSEYLTSFASDGATNAYRYEYSLPAGFMVDSAVRLWDTTSSNPFEVQNDFIKKATGLADDVMTQILPTGSNYTNMNVSADANGSFYNYSQNNASTAATGELSFTVDKAQSVYVYFNSGKVKNYTASVNGASKGSFDCRYSYVQEIGYCNAGDTVTITFSTEAASQGSFTVYVYGSNSNVMDEAYGILSANGLNITDYSSTKLTGTVNVSEKGVLYTSIPYESGWKVKVDGKTVPIKPIQDALISIDLDAGQHEITFSYVPAGFIPGLFLSLVCLGLLVAVSVLQWKKKKVPAIEAILEPCPRGEPEVNEI